MNDIQLFKPHESLAPYINGYLVSKIKFDGTERPVFTPKGTAAIITIFNINSNSYLTYPTKEARIYFKNHHTYLFGQMTKVGNAHFEGAFEFFCIVFTPTGLFHFLNKPASECTDKVTPLNEIGFEVLHQRILEVSQSFISLKDSLSSMDELLLGHFSSMKPKKPHVDMSHMVDYIFLKKGIVGLDDLIEQIGIGKRAFQIYFKNQVGVPPKVFCRIVRFNLLLIALEKDPFVDILELAINFGYNDSPHLYKDFTTYLGMSPRKYQQLLVNHNLAVEREIKKDYLK